MSMFIGDEPGDQQVFIQYKNTDICFDFTCKCGKQGHYDGYFAYLVECPECHTIWEMPCYLIPRISQRDDSITPVQLEVDEEQE